MELNEIKILLEKYYEGLTSIEEEYALRNFFAQQNVPDEMASDRELFSHLDTESKIIPVSSQLPDKLESWIDRRNKNEQKTRYIRLGYKLASIAAGIAILVVCYLFVNQNQKKLVSEDTYSDPQLAYAEVKRTLLYISEKLNKGTKPLSNVSRLNRGVEELSSFSSFGSGLKQLELVSKYYEQTNNAKQ